MATGAPNPASASRTAPKQNAMISPWIRWSVLTATNDRLITSNAPDFTVMLWIQIAFTTIHIAGNTPNAAPSSAESPAWSAGIWYTTRATANASANPITEAIQAFSFRPPSRTNSTRSGNAASRAESHRLPIGATCCWYIAVSMTGRVGRILLWSYHNCGSRHKAAWKVGCDTEQTRAPRRRGCERRVTAGRVSRPISGR